MFASGVWNGKLQVAPQVALKLLFHFNSESRVLLDSPDQGAYGIEGNISYLSADSVSLEVPALAMKLYRQTIRRED